MGQQVKIENCVINWPTLFTPTTSKNFPNNPPTYGIECVLDQTKDAKALGEIKAALDGQNSLTFGDKPRALPTSWKVQPDGKIHLRASAGATQKPQVVDQARNIVHADDGSIYAGCTCNVVIDIYTTVNHGGKVCVGLLAVQKVADGERMDNRPNVEDLFAPIPVTGSAPSGSGGVNPLF